MIKLKGKVFISLVNWSNWRDTLNVVQQLIKFDQQDYELVIGVVDNDSPNNSFEQLSNQLPKWINLTQADSNSGYAAGHLLNLKDAKKNSADYFWVLNSDIDLLENVLPKLLKASQELEDQALVGSVTLSDESTIDFGGSEWNPNDTKFHYNDWKGKPMGELLKKHPKYYRVQSLEGSSLLIPMNIIEKHGFMKTDFFMYGEETDYCLRLDEKGVPSYVATKSQLIHQNEGSLMQNSNAPNIKDYYRRRNHLRIQKEHFGMSSLEAFGYPDGVIQNLKTCIKGKNTKGYYFALGSIHCALNIKGKKI